MRTSRKKISLKLRNKMKIFTGKVISTNMAKTATVSVERVIVHPVYKKRYKRTRKYQVHDEVGVSVGQEVNFVACKPYSKTKKWEIIAKPTSKKKVSKAKNKEAKK
jgi:small subunit ribosomal protein S17